MVGHRVIEVLSRSLERVLFIDPMPCGTGKSGKQSDWRVLRCACDGVGDATSGESIPRR